MNGVGEYVISSGESKNGIVGRTDVKAKIFSSNTITVDMFGNSFYHPYKYKIVTHARIFSLTPKNPINENIGIYIITSLRFLKHLFSYGNMCSWEKIKELSIVLPINKDNKVDYNFIEEYVSELKEERVCELETYLNSAGFKDCTLTQSEIDALRSISLGKKQMAKFSIVKEFSVSNSHNILKSDVIFGSGSTPYVTASEGNNSIVSYISYDPNMIEKGNSIMIGGKTLVVTYQPNDFFSNDSHNLVLTINHETGRTESAQLFMVAALYKSLSPKYSWGDSISKTKIQNDEVFLPIKNDGSIDFDFMNTYVNAIKKQCISKLKEEFNI